MIKLVVFDWNGVLIADAKACLDADNHILKAFGGNKISMNKYRNTVTIPAIDFYSQHGVSKKILLSNSKKWSQIFHEFYEKRASKTRSRKGANKILKWIKDKGIKCAILSNHTVEGINFQLERLKMEKYIHVTLANSAKDASLKARNKLEKLRRYIRNNNYMSKEVVIIGDSPEEIEIGKSLGLKTVAITNGYYSKFRLKEKKPDYLIDSLNELKRIVN